MEVFILFTIHATKVFFRFIFVPREQEENTVFEKHHFCYYFSNVLLAWKYDFLVLILNTVGKLRIIYESGYEKKSSSMWSKGFVVSTLVKRELYFEETQGQEASFYTLLNLYYHEEKHS